MSERRQLLALYRDFDEAREVILGLKAMDKGGTPVRKMRLVSPVPHEELEDLIGTGPVKLRRFTLCGALLGASFGFFLSAAMGESMFTVQPQSGKPVIWLPANFVIMYELTILFGVWFTLFGFLFGAGLPTLKPKLYSHTVAEDQVGIWVEVAAAQVESMRDFLRGHRPVEILEHA